MARIRSITPARHLDVVTFGEAMAMFIADQPGPLEHVSRWRSALAGAETNVAIGLARLGHRSGWIGRVGNDPFGRFAFSELAANRVDVSGVTSDQLAPTGLVLKAKANGQDPQNIYRRDRSAGSRLTATEDSDALLASARHLHVTGIPLALSSRTRAFTFRALDIARDVGATISFDPNLRPTLWSDRQAMNDLTNACGARADWVFPGLSEARRLTGLRKAGDIAAHYLDAGATLVAIKDGSRGSSLHTPAGTWSHRPFAVTAIDTVGAGDGFATGIISAMLEGLSPEAVLERGAAIGALAVTGTGDTDGLPDRTQLSAFLRSAATGT